MFSDYLRRQLSHRGNVADKLNISRSTYYRHLNDPNEITIGELKKMVIVGELDESVISDFIYRRIK